MFNQNKLKYIPALIKVKEISPRGVICSGSDITAILSVYTGEDLDINGDLDGGLDDYGGEEW